MDQEDEDSNSDNPPPLIGENPVLSQFIENMGLHYQEYGLPRIAGRIVGLLLVTLRPISSEEMADALQVSRSSISTNLRTLLMTELIEKVSLPGDRVDYYVLGPETWQKSLEMRLSTVFPLRDMAEEGLEGLDASHPARSRLKEMIAWVNLVEDMVQRLQTEWQSIQEAPV